MIKELFEDNSNNKDFSSDQNRYAIFRNIKDALDSFGSTTSGFINDLSRGRYIIVDENHKKETNKISSAIKGRFMGFVTISHESSFYNNLFERALIFSCGVDSSVNLSDAIPSVDWHLFLDNGKGYYASYERTVINGKATKQKETYVHGFTKTILDTPDVCRKVDKKADDSISFFALDRKGKVPYLTSYQM